jgi:hypothetical protein
MRIYLFFFLIFLVLVFLFWTAEGFAKGNERRLAEAAGTLINKDMVVVCDPDIGLGSGFAEIPGNTVWLSDESCGALAALDAGDYTRPDLDGPSLIALAHESRHIRGYYNEARVECWALQKTDDLARLFHVPEWYIPSLWHFAYKDSQDLQKINKEYKNKKKCKPNGAWDQSPGDGIWP